VKRGLRFAPYRLPYSLALLALVAGASRCAAQDYYYYMQYMQQENPPLTVPQVRYAAVNVEAEKNKNEPKQNGGGSTSDRLYVAPTVGIGWAYFVYHPDLLSFSTLFEPGYQWEQYGGSGGSRNDNAVLLNGNATATLLKLKPYSTTFTYDRAHENYHYDFFNSATVDTERWGANTGYREGPVPTIITFDHSHVDSSGLSYDSTSDQTTVGLQSQNQRQRDNYTSLNYQYVEYDSTSSDTAQTFSDYTSAHHLSLDDVEHFDRSTLSSTMFYDHLGGDQTPSDDVNLMLNYDLQHTPHLRSFYGYSFSDYSSDGNTSMNNAVHAGLNHQLYDSLNTMGSVSGANSTSDSGSSTLDVNTATTEGSINYTKQLGDWGRLTIGNSTSYSYTDQTSSGTQLFIANETHVVPLNQIFFLNQPRDTMFVSLTDSTGLITYVQGADYNVITSTDPWQIQILSGGPNNLTAGKVVRANYYAQPNPTGSYTTFNNSAQIRLDFWHDRAGLYARYNFTQNHANSPGFVFENVDEFQVGGDLNWGRVRLDANYTDRSSSLYDYQAVNTSESYTLLESARNSASLNFHQQWSTYPNAGTNGVSQTTSYYSYTGRYTFRPIAGLEWNNEAGYNTLHGGGFDQSFIVARTYLSWIVGKLDVHLGYEFNNDDYPSQRQERNFLFLRLRRNF
jgi:hypothetical protein